MHWKEGQDGEGGGAGISDLIDVDLVFCNGLCEEQVAGRRHVVDTRLDRHYLALERLKLRAKGAVKVHVQRIHLCPVILYHTGVKVIGARLRSSFVQRGLLLLLLLLLLSLDDVCFLRWE